MTSTLGFSFEGAETPSQARALVRTAEAGGVRHLWIACHLFRREPIAQAAMMLAATRDLRVTLMAISPYSIHPVYAVMAAATLDEWFPGRVGLCFGVGAPRDLEAAGIAAPQPLQTMRETMAIARALLSGEMVRHEGQRFKVQGRRLEIGAGHIPLMLAASGPQMLELSGEIADGVLISAGTSVAFIQWCLDLVARGEAKAGRRIQRVALVYAAAAERAGDAHQSLRRTLAFILRGAHHGRNIELGGGTLDQEALARAFAAEDWDVVERLMTDDLVTRHAASGRPEDVRDRFGDYAAIGLDEIVLAGQGDVTSFGAFLAALKD